MAANSGSWQKGKSGNPGGRSKTDLQIKEHAKGYTKIALATLEDVCRNSESDVARVNAAVALLNRAWGTPRQSVDLTNSDGSLASAWAAARQEMEAEEQQEADVTH